MGFLDFFKNVGSGIKNFFTNAFGSVKRIFTGQSKNVLGDIGNIAGSIFSPGTTLATNVAASAASGGQNLTDPGGGG